MSKVLKLFISMTVPLLAGGIGSIFTTPAIGGWYAELEKPFFSPPNWLFAPVWTILYILMGVSLYLVWTDEDQTDEKGFGIAAFSIQLVLNIIWSYLFFGLKSPLWAFLEILLLWLAIAATIYFFFRVNKAAAFLLAPYILWVTFAALLNLAIFILNPV